MKNLIQLLLLTTTLTSCGVKIYNPSVVQTVVVKEKIKRNGSYVAICSDGYDRYKIKPFSRIPIGERVDMDKATHSYRIVRDINGKVNIGK